MQKTPSLPLGVYPNVPIFEKYSDDEEDFKVHEGLLNNGLSSSSTFQQEKDQQCNYSTVDDSYEFVILNSNENLLSFDTSFKEIIVGESNQRFYHDIYFKNHPSFDHYGDNDVEYQ